MLDDDTLASSYKQATGRYNSWTSRQASRQNFHICTHKIGIRKRKENIKTSQSHLLSKRRRASNTLHVADRWSNVPGIDASLVPLLPCLFNPQRVLSHRNRGHVTNMLHNDACRFLLVNIRIMCSKKSSSWLDAPHMNSIPHFPVYKLHITHNKSTG